jgi:hypothetical protein
MSHFNRALMVTVAGLLVLVGYTAIDLQLSLNNQQAVNIHSASR